MRTACITVIALTAALSGPAWGDRAKEPGPPSPEPEGAAVVARAEALMAAGRPAEAEAVYRDWFARNPSSARACEMLAAFLFQRGGVAQGFEEGMPVLETCVERRGPADADAHQDMARFYWHRAYRDATLSDAEKDRLADQALRHLEAALAARPNLMDALVYEALTLRLKAALSLTSEERRPEYLRQADALRARAADLKRSGEGETGRATLPSPPPPPLNLPHRVEETRGVLRVGGAIKGPRKIKTVPPVYPEEAKAARIEGTVVLDCTIDADGRVAGVQVLRGFPLLDEAAVDAVRRWEYEPTYQDGVAVPVIMTVTVNFRLR